MAKRDYYEVLGVKKDATEKEIQQAYRQKARAYHPDANPDDSMTVEKFKEAASAYEVLGDPQKRASYDRFGHDARHVSPNDIFSSFFGGGFGSSRPRQERGKHIQVQLEIDLLEAFKGCEKDVVVERKNPCNKCSGSGAAETKKCDFCDGSGQQTIRQDPFVIQTTCNQCRGEGTVAVKACAECKGTGFDASVIETIKVDIPSGVSIGDQLRLQGQGEVHRSSGIPGDLFVVINVKKHEFIERDGENLICEFPINYTQLVFGTEIEIPTMEEVVKLKVPAGSQPNCKFRLSGLGMPVMRSNVRGDLYAIAKLEVPRNISKKYKNLLRKLADLEDGKNG